MAKKLLATDTIVSIIIVTCNDEDIIEERLLDIKRAASKLGVNYEILVVDNNSQDRTIDKIKNLRGVMSYTRILVLSKQYDKEIALTAGLDNCVGDHAILFNIYTDPSEAKSKLLSKLMEGYDIVIGKTREEVIKHSLVNKFFLYTATRLSTHGFYHQQSYLMGLNRRAINSITRTRRKNRHFSYIHSLVGLKKHFFEYKPIRRFKHKLKGESFFNTFIVVVDSVISNSFKPIRFISFVGMFLSAIFLLYILLIVSLVVFFGMKHLVPQGWVSVSTVIGAMFFLLFTLLWLISEYIIRILNETRDEPFYFISEEISQSTILPKKARLNIA